MTLFRTFLNDDPPKIARLWSDVSAVPGRIQNMSVSILERHVFSKPYFDRHGLILAEKDGDLIGFVHAGFGPNEGLVDISMSIGVVCLLMVKEIENAEEIRLKLVEKAEQYLLEREATEIRAGCIDTRSPFYLGLYGGSDMAGILESDSKTLQAFEKTGYEAIDRTRLFQLDAVGYRPPADRQTVKNRRKFVVETDFQVRSSNWWEGCQFGNIDRIRFRLRPRSGGPPAGELTLWDMGPFNPGSGHSAMGLIDLYLDESYRGQGVATFFVGESIRQMQTSGVGMVESQVNVKNEIATRLFLKLGFQPTEFGVSLRKPTVA